MIANFGNKIKQLINEATALKTTHLKTSSGFRTATQTVTLTFGMFLVDIPVPGGDDYSYTRSDRIAYVWAKSKSGQSMLTSLTFNPTNNSLADRQYVSERFSYDSIWSTGENVEEGAFEVYIAAGNSDDLARLRRGETVTVSIPITVTATDDFSLEVRYERIT